MAIFRVPIELTSPEWPGSCFNVFHVRDVDEAGSNVGEALTALHTFYTTLDGIYASTTTITFPAQVVNVETDTEVDLGTAPLDVVGTATTDAPWGLAAVVSWKTSIRARRGRGRTFLGPISGNNINTQGKLDTAVQAAIQGAVDTIVADSSGAVNGWALGIYGQSQAGIPDVKVLRDVTGGTARGEFAFLRSRRS